MKLAMLRKSPGLLLALVSLHCLAAPSVPQLPNQKSRDPYLAVQVKNTISKRAKKLQSCWLTYLEASKDVTELKVELDWQIKRDGTVLSPEIVHPAALEPKFSECLLGKVGEIQFPPHEGKIPKYVSHKFTFSKTE